MKDNHVLEKALVKKRGPLPYVRFCTPNLKQGSKILLVVNPRVVNVQGIDGYGFLEAMLMSWQYMLVSHDMPLYKW